MRISTAHLRSVFTRHIFSATLLLTFSFATTLDASCPPPSATTAGWARGSVVYYNVSSLPTTPTNLQTQAIAALNAWTSANNANGSGVSFQASNSSNPATLTFQTGSTVLGGPAETDPHNVAPDNALLDHATITVDTGHVGFDPNGSGYSAALLKAFLHEIGHTMGLGDNPVNQNQSCGGQTAGDSVMNGMCGTNDYTGNMPSSITGCDQGTVFNDYYTGPCPGTECNEGGSGTQADFCTYPSSGCPPGYVAAGGCCSPEVPSPVVIDVDGSGFQLTNADDGVWFDFYGTGQPIKISWTAIGSTNAWLVLDRNGNGRIDNASEMFGNYTTQPNSPDKNGFLALLEFDKTGAGGNEDGKITVADPMFTELRLWQDTNHNGISEPNELHSLSDLGIATIDCHYKEARRIDAQGNQFRYRAKVLDTHRAQVGRWAWDVFLVSTQ